MKIIEIMDTTLRDGEQTCGVSFTATEKFTIAKYLLEVINIDRIEIASARVSEGEFDAVNHICQWASENDYIDKIEVLTFLDEGKSLDWMQQCGAKVQNLLTKGSLDHLTHQLRKKPSKHFEEIKKNIADAQKRNIKTNVYLEDWSRGMQDSPEYTEKFLLFLSDLPIDRILLPDTLGILNPRLTFQLISRVRALLPNHHLDFHSHNDYDLGTANVMEAILAGADGIHLTVNGLGERAGNSPLSSVLPMINDHLADYTTRANEKKLYNISKLVEGFSSIRLAENQPIVGKNVFTQTAGVHADGDKKNNLYCTDLRPERFGRTREYALGKTSGKANIEQNIIDLGIKLNNNELIEVTKRVIKLGDKKNVITQDDLPFIIADVLDRQEIVNRRIKIKNYVLSHARGLRPSATLLISIDNVDYQDIAQGDGQYDAFMNVIKKIYSNIYKPLPELVDYSVRIPPGGKTDALCETIITWHDHKDFRTQGLHPDQTVSALIATERMLNLMENRRPSFNI